MILSILIPTLKSREGLFQQLQTTLFRQIATAGLQGEVEVLSLCDSGEISTGSKRNALLAQARGAFVVFVDDDDEISDDYVACVCEAIRRNPDIDCIGVTGTMSFRGHHPRKFIHSIRFNDFSTAGGAYTGPAGQLNPMRRSIATAYLFRDVYYSEDIDWALRIRDDQRLNSEELIDTVLYHYRSRRHWYYQVLLDMTEPIRHVLGLRFSNRLRLYPGATDRVADL